MINYNFDFGRTILVFGGSMERVTMGMKFAQYIPNANIIVSAMPKSLVLAEADKFRVYHNRVHCFYGALDTLSEVVNTLEYIRTPAAKVLYPVSDDWHMERINFFLNLAYGDLLKPDENGKQSFWIKPQPVVNHPLVFASRTLMERSYLNAEKNRALAWKKTGNLYYSWSVLQRKSEIEANEFR